MTSQRAAYIGLGSNLGDRENTLEQAAELLTSRGFSVTARSSSYWTEPVGGPPQDWYLNAVVAGKTELAPGPLLEACLATEKDLGRVRRVRHGPRTLDVDLLLYGDEVRDGDELTLPHPRLQERRFVLVPLAEIAPGAVHPLLALTIAQLLARCPDPSQVLRQPPRNT